MKERVNQLFKDKFVLVMLVLGLLTIVAAAGAVKIRKGNGKTEESPYLEMKEPEHVVAGEESPDMVAGDSDAAEETKAAELSEREKLNHGDDGADMYRNQYEDSLAGQNQAEGKAEQAGASVAESLVLNFTENDKLSWPVRGNVILGYSMETTTWFPTLEQYKCNPANVIQGDVSTPVIAPADARVLEIGSNEEIGEFVRLDLGNEYTAVCGQLKEIPVSENEYLKKGDVLGYIAEPTKYYSVEGNNLYFELRHAGQAVDALDYLE